MHACMHKYQHQYQYVHILVGTFKYFSFASWIMRLTIDYWYYFYPIATWSRTVYYPNWLLISKKPHWKSISLSQLINSCTKQILRISKLLLNYLNNITARRFVLPGRFKWRLNTILQHAQTPAHCQCFEISQTTNPKP